MGGPGEGDWQECYADGIDELPYADAPASCRVLEYGRHIGAHTNVDVRCAYKNSIQVGLRAVDGAYDAQISWNNGTCHTDGLCECHCEDGEKRSEQ